MASVPSPPSVLVKRTTALTAWPPLQELQKGLQCKYVAVDASQALAAIFHQLLEQAPGNVDVAVAWARILREPPLEQLEEGCEVLERAASVSRRPGEFWRIKLEIASGGR